MDPFTAAREQENSTQSIAATSTGSKPEFGMFMAQEFPQYFSDQANQSMTELRSGPEISGKSLLGSKMQFPQSIAHRGYVYDWK